MKTKVKRGPAVFVLKLNRLEMLHLEAAIDALLTDVDHPGSYLGMYAIEYDEEVARDIHDELSNLRDVVISDES